MVIHCSDAHICLCLRRLATLRRRAPLTVHGGRKKSGEQFVEGVLGLVGGLRELGIQRGDIVAISALNSDLYLEWLLAVAFVGGISAPLNYRWSLEEARFAIKMVRPIMLVTDECSNYWYSKIPIEDISFLKWHVFINSPSDFCSQKCVLTTATLKKPALRSSSFDYLYPSDGTAIICFTSGTTGKPKGVAISHSALIVQSLAKIAIVGYSEEDVYLHTSPLCHIGGISSAMANLMAGSCHIFLPKFEAKSVIEAIEKLHVTTFITVPAMMADMISFIRMKGTWEGKQTVRKILNGAGGLSAGLVKDVAIFFPRAKLLSAYGMTEASSSITFLTLYDPNSDNLIQSPSTTGDTKYNLHNQPGAVRVGKPAPHIELKISSKDGSSVGRILTRGPHLMLGYWGQIPTKASGDGGECWLNTGDIGQIDEFGNLWLIGRAKGRLKSGGENVYPEEVEAVLSQHPGVSGVVVVGLPDSRLSEIVVACVKLRDNWKWDDSCSDHSIQSNNQTLSSKILSEFCREKLLTGFKIPKRFVLWSREFPLTTTGKLRRDEVRREIMANIQFLPSNL